MFSKLRLPALAVALALALAVMASAGGGPALAQPVDNPLPPLADLSIAYDYSTSPGWWLLTVRNNTVGRHPSVTASLVKVRVVFGAVNGYQETRIWEIRDLPPRGIATREYRSPLSGAPHWPTRAGANAPSLFPMLLHAEIIETDPVEPPGFQHNNATEGWVMAVRVIGRTTDSYDGYYTHGDISVGVGGISDRFPQEGGATAFTVTARNRPGNLPFSRGVSCGGGGRPDCEDTLLDVQVKIRLSPGLAFAADQQAPDGTTFDPATGIWDVGTLEYNAQRPIILALPVAVNLAGSLADLPLEERCLTAEVVRAVPWFALQRNKRENDTVTQCLGAPPLLLAQGEIALFHFLDCVGVTSTPCTSADTLELVVAGTGGGVKYRQPEEVTVHIRDPAGRHAGKWRTGKSRYHDSAIVDTPGVGITYRYVPTGYTQYLDAVSDVSPKQRPGTFSIIWSAQADFELLNADTITSTDPFDLEDTEEPYPAFLVFGTLGTYKLNLTIGATKSGTAYTDTGTYTFHVGPVAELEVRDAGPNPVIDTDRHAYTITAVNNGPDAAPAVEVRLTGVPEGVEAVPSHGSYDPVRAVWNIGRLSVSDAHRASGHAAEGPTLTLVTDDLAAPDITATIENTRDYCVRIKTGAVNPANDLECDGSAVPDGYTEHTANFLDYIEENGKDVEIAAHAGTGSFPGAPVGVKLTETPVGNILQWQPVERVNGHPVTHYQLQRLDLSTLRWEDAAEVTGTMYLDEDASPDFPAYRLRAVNRMGVEGPWSRPAPDEGLDQPGDPPTVTEVRITSTPAAGGTYQLGEIIALEVTFSEAVRVRGTPSLALGIGEAARQTPMSAHSGDTLTFRYVVADGDGRDTDGISVPENGLTLPEGASITSRSGKFAVLGFPGLDNQAGHKVNAPSGDPPPPPPFYVDPPEAPQALIATPGDGEVLLQWATYCCDEKDLYYQLWRGDDPTNWHTITGSGRDTDEHIVTGLTNDVPYRFRVRAVYGQASDGPPEHPGAASRMVVATPYDPTPPPGTPTPPPNNPPVFERPTDEDFKVVERAPRGTEVARVRATDPDGDTLTYTLSGENHSKFNIANVSGEGVITVAEEELSYTWEPGGVSFSIGVEVTDNRGGRDNRVVGVEVTPSEKRNNAPVAEEPGTLYVPCQGTPPKVTKGTTVGTIMADDPEGDPLWYILVDGAKEFEFEGGSTQNHPDPIWHDDHAVLISDGSGAKLKTVKELSGDICGKLITVVVEIEEKDNPGNNDTLVFEVRVDAPPSTSSRSTGPDEGGSFLLAALRSAADTVRGWWTGFSRAYAGLALPTSPVALYPIAAPAAFLH